MPQFSEEINQRTLIDADGQWRPEVLQQVQERAWALLKEELRIEAERRRAVQVGSKRRRGGR